MPTRQQPVSQKKAKGRKKHPWPNKKDDEEKASEQLEALSLLKTNINNNNARKISKQDLERQLHEIKLKEKQLEEQLRQENELNSCKKKGISKGGGGGGGGGGGIGKKKSKDFDVKGQLEEMKKKKQSTDKNNSNSYNPMKGAILDTLKKDLKTDITSSVDSSEDDDWTSDQENLLQKHLKAFQELMEVQPKRHTEAQIKMERRRNNELEAHQQSSELQAIRLTNANNNEIDPAKKKEEFLRKQQEKERKRNQEEIEELQNIGFVLNTKKSKNSEKEKNYNNMKAPVGGQGLGKNKPRTTWGPTPSEFQTKPNNTVVWPEIKPVSKGNIWSERERKQNMLETLIPKDSEEEEKMMQKALELSVATAEEELEFRRYYPPDDDDLAKIMVNRLTMESQQLAEWIDGPNRSLGKKKTDAKNRASSHLKQSAPIQPITEWNNWSKIDNKTENIGTNPKEKLPAKTIKTPSPVKIKSPLKSSLTSMEEDIENWSEEELCFNSHKDLMFSEQRSADCGVKTMSSQMTKPTVFTFDKEYYDPHGGARPKYQTANSIWSPHQLIDTKEVHNAAKQGNVDPEFERVEAELWSPLPTSLVTKQPQFSQRCTVDPQFETLSCNKLNNNNQDLTKSKVKVEQHRFDISYDSEGEDWDGDIDYVGPECDPETKTTHLAYTRPPSDIASGRICVEVESVKPEKMETIVNEKDSLLTETNIDESKAVTNLTQSKIEIKHHASEDRGVKFLTARSARSKFKAAKALFLSSQRANDDVTRVSAASTANNLRNNARANESIDVSTASNQIQRNPEVKSSNDDTEKNTNQTVTNTDFHNHMNDLPLDANAYCSGVQELSSPVNATQNIPDIANPYVSNDLQSSLPNSSSIQTGSSVSSSTPSIPIGLPPHLVNAYLMFLKQQEERSPITNAYQVNSSTVQPTDTTDNTYKPNMYLPNKESCDITANTYQPYDATSQTCQSYDTTAKTYQPYNATSNSYQAYDTTANVYQSYDSTANASQPYNTAANAYQLYDTTANAYQPYDTTANASQPYDTTANAYQPYDSTANAYQPYDTAANAYQPYNSTAKAYQSYDATANKYQPYDNTANAYQPYDSTTNTSGPYNTAANSYQPYNTAVNAYQHYDTAVNIYQSYNTTGNKYQPYNTTANAYKPYDTSTVADTAQSCNSTTALDQPKLAKFSSQLCDTTTKPSDNNVAQPVDSPTNSSVQYSETNAATFKPNVDLTVFKNGIPDVPAISNKNRYVQTNLLKRAAELNLNTSFSEFSRQSSVSASTKSCDKPNQDNSDQNPLKVQQISTDQANNFYNIPLMQRNLPSVYPSFNPFINAQQLPQKTYNPPVFTHSVQHHLKQQHKKNEEFDVPAAKVPESPKCPTSSVSNNKVPVTNKDRLKKRLDCINKVKTLMQEVKKESGIIT